MRLHPATALHGLQLAVLRCVSLLVPARRRADWWREWSSELWHVRQACTPWRGFSWSGEGEVAKFCLGSFQDALWLRGQIAREHVPLATTMGSAAQCILLLVGLLAGSYGVSRLLPGVALAHNLSPYRDARNLMLIRDADYASESAPTISEEQYRTWKWRRQNLFDGFAFYRMAKEAVSGVRQGTGEIAIASPNLFDLLGLRVRFADAGGEARSDLPRLILSDEAWRREFGGDRHIFGRVVLVGAKAAVVSGVAQTGSWRLPGKVDGWLLLRDGEDAPGGLGFVVGHLKPAPAHAQWTQTWAMTAPQPDGTMGGFLCSSLAERTRGAEGLFLFAVFLACLALPATTSLPLGEYRVSSQKVSLSKRLRRWGFLGCKIALLLPMVYFVSIDLAHMRTTINPFWSEYIQLVSSFSICLFGLRWVLRDQRQRCPVCLRRLTHPARVGQPSRSFLDWNGIELICVGGHGMLHIPEMQTSWFDTQRWLYLDSSWDVLFADAGLASAHYF